MNKYEMNLFMSFFVYFIIPGSMIFSQEVNMKKNLKLTTVAATVAAVGIIGMVMPVSASDGAIGVYEDVASSCAIEIEDEMLAGATQLSQTQSVNKVGDITTTKTVESFKLEDGSLVTDTTLINTTASSESAGTIDVTRYRNVTGFALVCLKASFRWTSGKAYCDSMDAEYTPQSGVVKDKFAKSIVNSGTKKVTAKVKYQFHKKRNAFKNTKGTFKVTCTSDGACAGN